MIWRRLMLVIAAGLLLESCAVNPVTGRNELNLISEKEEIDIGRKNYAPGQQQNGGQYVLEPRLAAYVRDVGQRMAQVSDRRQLPYEFVVLNDSTPNAWAMPGGKIALNRGLLTELKSEAELAAVIGHEIVHAAGRHGARGMESNLLLGVGAAVVSAVASDSRYAGLVDTFAGVGAGLLGMKYGRDLELEADHYGMLYLHRAGYDPQAAVSLQETFVRLSNSKSTGWLEGMFASHPPSQERVEANRALAATMPKTLRRGEAEYLAQIAPLLKNREAYRQHDEGRKALKAKEAEKALLLAAAALRIEPREALFHDLRGDAYALLERHPEAEAEYDKAIRLNPDFHDYYLGRGTERQRRGDMEAARADFAKASSLLPTAKAHYALGRIALNGGDKTAAAKHFESAAAAQDDDGQRAGLALAKLTLPGNPEKYLAATLERRGTQMVLVVSNKAPTRVADVMVTASNSARGQISTTVGTIEPRAQVRVNLPWSVDDVPQGARLSARVVSARVVD